MAICPSMRRMDGIEFLPHPADGGCEDACAALEAGRIVQRPMAFDLAAHERRFLSPGWSSAAAKNISLRPGACRARGAAGAAQDAAELAALIARHGRAAHALVETLVPRYRGHLAWGNGSFRPVAIEEATRSWRGDDKRLHVDAFASNPVHGRRILRVFTNVGSRPRAWLQGEPFESFALRFFPRVRRPWPGAAALLRLAGVTKRRRSAYDHYMLGMHDAAKADAAYQREAPRAPVEFAPGSTWIAFTDQVVHAATAGQYALEQTFYLDSRHMADRSTSPLAVLERMAARPLA
jgi:hypothetical protein